MNCKEIIIEYLKKNGYDGLINEEGECACDIDDLLACGESVACCDPGYKIKDKSGEYDWLITRTKPKLKEEKCINQKSVIKK